MESYVFQMRGPVHAALGGALEDRVRLARLSEQVLGLAVADGMGTCPLAAEAADVASDAGIRALSAVSPARSDGYGASCAMRAAPLAALSCARNALLAHAGRLGRDVGDLGTTLMVVQYEEAEQTLSYAYSGDGGIIALGADLRARLVIEPQSCGEGRTHALTSSDWWRVGAEAGVLAFLVCTDGLLEGLMDADEPSWMARDLLMGGPGRPAELDRALSSTGQVGEPLVPTSDVGDDRTLVACWSQRLIETISERRAAACRSGRWEGERG